MLLLFCKVFFYQVGLSRNWDVAVHLLAYRVVKRTAHVEALVMERIDNRDFK